MSIAQRPIEYHFPFYKVDPARNRPSVIGTGILLKIPDYTFLLSAAHVFDELDGHISFPETGIEDPIALSVTTSPIPASGRKDDHVDLGLVRLPQEVASLLGGHYRFVELDDLDTSDEFSATKQYSFTGFPGTRARPRYAERKIDIDCYEYKVDAFQISSTTPPWHPALHVAGVFDRTLMQISSGTRITAPEPNGMSGGGVWTSNETNGYKLVGIGINWDAALKILVGVRIGAALCFLRQIYPELDPFLPRDPRIDIKFTA